MTVQDIANRLAELCRKGDFETAQKELYAEDVVSIEPVETPEFEKEVKGLDKVFEKGEKFMAMVEKFHGSEASAPVIAGNSFAFVLNMDLTMKGHGRMNLEELCVYTVQDGKVVLEQFFM